MTEEKSGRDRARVNRSQSPGKAPVLLTRGIYGHTFIDSSLLVGHEWFLESRLVARLGSLGSTESPLIWKPKTTPAGRTIYRLAPLTRRISDSASTGAQWPTPTVADVQGGRKSRSGARSGELLLNGLAATWSTPRAMEFRETPESFWTRNNKIAANRTKGASGVPLAVQVAAATWVTPSAWDWKDSPGMSTTGINPDGSERTRMDMLPRQVAGTTPSGSSEPTESRGALNPEFVYFLMGFPIEWRLSASRAMQSYRRSPRSSSQPSPKTSKTEVSVTKENGKMEIIIKIEDAEAARWMEAVASALQKAPATKTPKPRKQKSEDIIEEIRIETKPEDIEQDRLDEAALAVKEPGTVTRDDLRGAFMALVTERGPAYAMAHIVDIIGATVDEIPEEGIAEAIAKIEAHLFDNERPTQIAISVSEPVQTVTEAVHRPTKVFTRQDVIDAALGYARAYDGPVPAKDAKIAMADVPRIIERVAGVKSIAQIPDDSAMLQAVTEAIVFATERNPYGRERH